MAMPKLSAEQLSLLVRSFAGNENLTDTQIASKALELGFKVSSDAPATRAIGDIDLDAIITNKHNGNNSFRKEWQVVLTEHELNRIMNDTPDIQVIDVRSNIRAPRTKSTDKPAE